MLLLNRTDKCGSRRTFCDNIPWGLTQISQNSYTGTGKRYPWKRHVQQRLGLYILWRVEGGDVEGVVFSGEVNIDVAPSDGPRNR